MAWRSSKFCSIMADGQSEELTEEKAVSLTF